VSFDHVAPHYRWLETVAFGKQLQQARVAFIREIGRPHRALIVGEGNGRFLAELLRVHPGLQVDCIEASARMIALAQQRVNAAHVRFIHANVRQAVLEAETYDLIVTHFLLDCFDEKTLPTLVGKLASAATPVARWLVADFCEPTGGWRLLRARFLIALMYLFFRAVAGIEARRLVDYRPLLRGQGFDCTNEMVTPNEMMRSELWRRQINTARAPQLSS
jgi:ubiquinone/menaquinone biosynthesis C-methylase UbiE